MHAARSILLRQAHSSSLSTAKVFGSEAAVRVITNLMQVVGVDSYGHELPLAVCFRTLWRCRSFAPAAISAVRRPPVARSLCLDPAV